MYGSFLCCMATFELPVVTVEDTLDGNYLYFDVVPSDIVHVELSSEVPSAPYWMVS